MFGHQATLLLIRYSARRGHGRGPAALTLVLRGATTSLGAHRHPRDQYEPVTIAPAVPFPESSPTTLPVAPSLDSRSFVTIGVTRTAPRPDAQGSATWSGTGHPCNAYAGSVDGVMGNRLLTFAVTRWVEPASEDERQAERCHSRPCYERVEHDQ